jgi:hypothetical protein
MTVKSIPYWQQKPAWGAPGHEPSWQNSAPTGRWGWWNDPSVTDESIWKASQEYKAGQDLLQRLDQLDVPRMAGMFMSGVNPKDYLM